ncbi:MAG: PIN domain-containing protein [Candidatus Acidiferrum sp.]
MIYLLDVNALVALAFLEHEFHHRTARWILKLSKKDMQLATCAISELGFLRVLSQAPAYQVTVAQGKQLLAALQVSQTPKFSFISDDVRAEELSRWANNPRQLTDGHLLQLAKKHGATLATLDKSIPGAFVIPH